MRYYRKIVVINPITQQVQNSITHLLVAKLKFEKNVMVVSGSYSFFTRLHGKACFCEIKRIITGLDSHSPVRYRQSHKRENIKKFRTCFHIQKWSLGFP
jgi:hypothetical protein